MIDGFPSSLYDGCIFIRVEEFMKKAMIVALAVVTVAVLLPQNAIAAKVGIKGGFNFASWSYSGVGGPDFEFMTLKGPVIGGFLTLSLGPIAIQPEVYYSRRGVRYEEAPNWLEYRLNYLEVPVLAKFTISPGPIAPVVFAGGYGAYLMSAQGVTVIDDIRNTQDIKEFLKESDYGLVFGGGVEFKLALVKLIVEGRYTLGLSNILKDDPDDTYKNKGFSILVGIGF